MALEARVIFCGFKRQKKLGIQKVKRVESSVPENLKFLIQQPRDAYNNLRSSYGSDRPEVIQPRRIVLDDDVVDEEYDVGYLLHEFIENSRNRHNMEMVAGRLAMVVLAASFTMELVTGDSLFLKMDPDIGDSAGACVLTLLVSIVLACSSKARDKMARVLNLRIKTFFELFVDNLLECLFVEDELNDQSDDL